MAVPFTSLYKHSLAPGFSLYIVIEATVNFYLILKMCNHKKR